MKNYDELYFTIKNNTDYFTKGSFNYKSNKVKNDGDISCSYNKIKFVDDKIEISYCEEVASNVKVTGYECCSYSYKTSEKVIGTYTFDELIESEYWEEIVKRYPFKELAFDKYKGNYIEETRDKIELVYIWGLNRIYMSLDKINGQIDISTNEETGDFYGKVYDLKILEQEEYEELETKAKTIDLMKNHKVSILENGYVIDNVYYENIDDFEELKDSDD